MKPRTIKIELPNLELGNRKFHELFSDPNMLEEIRRSDPGSAETLAKAFSRMRLLNETANNAIKDATVILENASKWTYAEAREYMTEHPPTVEMILLLSEMAASQAVSARQTKVALERYTTNRIAKEFVLSEWENGIGDYKGKNDFSRVMSGRVLELYSLHVSPDQIARKWLPKKKSK